MPSSKTLLAPVTNSDLCEGVRPVPDGGDYDRALGSRGSPEQGREWGRAASADPLSRASGAPGPSLPPPPARPPRCAYVLLVPVAPRLVLEPGPDARAPAAAARPGSRRLRLRAEGLARAAAVVLGALAAQEVAGLGGRRGEGARRVDLAGEALVQRSHRAALAAAPQGLLPSAPESFAVSAASRVPEPHPLQKKQGRKRKRKKEAAGEKKRQKQGSLRRPLLRAPL